MNILTFIIFTLLQICLVQGFGAQAGANTFGATQNSVGAANAFAAGNKANAAAQVIAGPGFVSSTAVASASGKKHHKPPPKKHNPPPKKHAPPPKKHTWNFPKITIPYFNKKH